MDGDKTENINLAEEAGFLRQKCSSLALRGHYADCAKLIEENIKLLYDGERWPENFFAALKTFRTCYPALNRGDTPGDYIAKLLKKNGIPYVFAEILESGEAPVRWSAEFFRNHAVALRAEKNSEAALAYCDIAIKIDPASSNQYLFRSWLLEDLGKTAEAITAALQALELNEANVRAGQTLARLYAASDTVKALSFAEEMIVRFPGNDEFYAEKAAILAKIGRNAEALRVYEEASGMSPYNAEYHFSMAEIFMLERDETAAVLHYKRAVALSPRHAPALLRLAFLFENKQPVAALNYVSTYVSVETENIGAMLLRGRLLLRAGNNADAIGQFLDILAIDEKNADALGGAAAAYMPGDSEKAAEYYTLALSVMPRNASFFLGRATACLSLEKYTEAAADFKAAAALDRGNPEPLARLASLYRETDPKTALSYITRALTLSPENPSFHIEKAHILLKMNKPDDAIDAFDRAAVYEPGNAELHCELGLLLQKTGNGASAVKNLVEAVNIDPRLPQAFHALGELLMYSRPDEAFRYINAAIRLAALNAGHCFLKGAITIQLGSDGFAVENLKRRFADTEDVLLQKEIEEIAGGNYLKVSLACVDRAVALEPDNNVYLCEQARLLYVLGRVDTALERYRALLKADPDNHGALFGTGIILAAQNDAKAGEYLDKAIALSPETAAYYAGKAAFLAGDEACYAQAVACYDKALKLDTYNPLPALEKGRLMEARGDIPEAMASYRRTLLINPNALEAASRMAVLLAPVRPDNALAYIDRAVYLSPDDPKLHMWRARILYGQGNRADGTGECEKALALCDSSASGCYELAVILSDGFPLEALDYATRAAGENGGKAACQTLCGKLCLKLGDADRARGFFEAAVAKEPDNAEAAELNAELLYSLQLPESVQAAEALGGGSISASVIKAKILSEIASPPRIKEAAAILADAVKQFPADFSLREYYVAMLVKSRSFIRYAAEKSKLERLRAKMKSSVSEAEADGDVFRQADAVTEAEKAKVE